MAALARASHATRAAQASPARELATPHGALARLERLATAVARARLPAAERLALEVECCAVAASLHALVAHHEAA